VDFKAHRIHLRLSQMALSRMARVSRYRIFEAERGDATLTAEELERIRAALRSEVVRIQAIARRLDIADNAA
jgi:predicted transcriptional regulator